MVSFKLAGQDLAQLAEALASLGFWPVEEGLPWLIPEGARSYLADQRAWEELDRRGVPDQDPVRLELQRREALAHVLSMRARTLAREQERETLRQTGGGPQPSSSATGPPSISSRPQTTPSGPWGRRGRSWPPCATARTSRTRLSAASG